MSSELPQYQKANPPSEVRNVQARFQADEVGNPPIFVQIEGVVYRREEDQEGTNSFLEMQELQAELTRRLEEETWGLVSKLIDTLESQGVHDMELAEARLLKIIPRHEAAIKNAFWPDEFDLNSEDYVRHHYCTLAACVPPED